MIYNNKSAEFHREGFNIRHYGPNHAITPSCSATFTPLRECLGSTLSIHLDQSGCDQTSFKSQCTGAWRRHFIEQVYRQQVNNTMYDQKTLDAYAEKKNDCHYAKLS